jgi:hypothetical protein
MIMNDFYSKSKSELLDDNAQNQLPDDIPISGLVGWWSFSGNANDESGNGNHGSISGVIFSDDRNGIPNSAVIFDGVDDFIVVPDNNTLNNNFLTVSLWVSTTTSIYQQLIYKVNSDDALNEEYSIALNYEGTPDKMDFSIKTGNNCLDPGQGWQHTNLVWPLASGVWNNLIFTYDGTQSRIYINGSLKATGNFSTSIIDNCPGGDLLIGKDWNDGGFFQGKMDDIAIWNRSLNSTEVSQVFHSGQNNVGINVDHPIRDLHVNSVLRLEPREIAPTNPEKGDIYFDGTSNMLRVFDGTTWQNCW